MRRLNEEKTDVVSVILDDHELLNAFVDTLEVQTKEVYEEFTLSNLRADSLGKFQKIRCYLWKYLKDVLHKIAQKNSGACDIAEYHAKKEVKKIKLNK